MPIIVCKCARNFNDNAEKRFDSSPFFLSRAISIWQWTDNAFPIKWLGLEKKKSPSLQRIDLILLGHLHTQWLYRARRIRFPSWIYWIVVITIVFVIDVIIATLTMSTWFPFCIFLLACVIFCLMCVSVSCSHRFAKCEKKWFEIDKMFQFCVGSALNN